MFITMPEDTIVKEKITIIRPVQKNNVLNDKDYYITKFHSKTGELVVYFEQKENKGE